MARKKLITTRTEAKLLHLPRFFTGVPCIRGHISERYTSCNRCCACHKKWKAELDKTKLREYEKAFYHSNDNYRLLCNIRTRLRHVLGLNYRSTQTEYEVGCPLGFLREHVASLFRSGMTWDNRGEFWELDHVVPLHKFDLTDTAQLLEACHYTNLQPITLSAHRRKLRYDLRSSLE